ncbi:receptor-like protein 44 [Phoenix dactylifera]|uniref:Receptor-like protein 44 n=1 Tax=Phoenix dactylifera TaxID=42345 RepID=A0A8B7BUM6_PHODC|nr:receptor-like protein 44 [Phoenix dactylifera]
MAPPPLLANLSLLLSASSSSSSSSNHCRHELASPSPRPHRETAATAPFLFFLLLIITLMGFPLAAVGDPDDERCLTNLRQSLSDPTHSLRNWTKTTYAAPCNGFTSYLGGATCNNGRVYKLSLANLSLSGTLSPFLANCTNLQSLDLSSNALTGPIPPELSSLLNLAVLNLSANRLSGPIPPQLALCAYLNVIDLHGNALSGPIPDQLGLLVRLSTFDVSYNQLSGPIPVLLANRSGGLPRFNVSSFIGNKDLYGYPLPPARGKGLSVLAIVGIGLGSGLLSLVLSFTAVCIWLRVTEQQATTPGEEGKISHLMPDY